jgi:pimeloyl-ACP methyl ester carboxylesterase
MKWALSSILCWQPGPPPGLPVHQIHGARDLLLPVDCVAADAVIPTGGHMINLTHPTDVNAFIAQAARLTHPAKDRPTGAAP